MQWHTLTILEPHEDKTLYEIIVCDWCYKEDTIDSFYMDDSNVEDYFFDEDTFDESKDYRWDPKWTVPEVYEKDEITHENMRRNILEDLLDKIGMNGQDEIHTKTYKEKYEHLPVPEQIKLLRQVLIKLDEDISKKLEEFFKLPKSEQKKLMDEARKK